MFTLQFFHSKLLYCKTLQCGLFLRNCLANMMQQKQAHPCKAWQEQQMDTDYNWFPPRLLNKILGISLSRKICLKPKSITKAILLSFFFPARTEGNICFFFIESYRDSTAQLHMNAKMPKHNLLLASFHYSLMNSLFQHL